MYLNFIVSVCLLVIVNLKKNVCKFFVVLLGQWNKEDGHPMPPRPTCTNHDDGETNAVIQCNTCGNLCADCDRFLHLHRKTRNHQRQVSRCISNTESLKSLIIESRYVLHTIYFFMKVCVLLEN